MAVLDEDDEADLVIARSSPEGERKSEWVDRVSGPEVELSALVLSLITDDMMLETQGYCPGIIRLLSDAGCELTVARGGSAKMRSVDIAVLAAHGTG